ncbi:PREDICTED: neuronal pentraxin-2, partial [Tauraco erythrolophus]|uniref:neuronal pentraxin-2 n=1 Tax=Tauraco erythrolophus TaxID=121530 RepID=UPI0005235904
AGCPLPPVPMQGGALPPEEELKATVLQLRETVLQQKETIGSQRDAIRELTGKLSRCENADGKSAAGTWKKELGKGKDTMGDLPRDPAQGIDQLSRPIFFGEPGVIFFLLVSLKHQLRANVSYAALPNDLREMLQRRLGDLERQLLSKVAELEDEKSLLHNETSAHRQKTETALNALLERGSELEKGNSAFKSPDEFKVSLPLRTNYLYGKIKKTLPELYAFTVCLWLRSSASPGIGTPFSYAVPGQANEIVLIEWGNNPIELLINDKVAQLPLFVSDGKWHHICITWTTRDGMWEAFQDGEKLGTGENLAPWHPIKPGGVLILGQEQDTVGGRFDATQAFVGEMSQFNIWDRVLKAEDIMNIANCSTNMPGNIIPWVDNNVDVFGGTGLTSFYSRSRSPTDVKDSKMACCHVKCMGGSRLPSWECDDCGNILVHWETPAVQSTNRSSTLRVLCSGSLFWLRKRHLLNPQISLLCRKQFHIGFRNMFV